MFGDFQQICQRSPLPLCALVKPLASSSSSTYPGILAQCYSRSVVIANTMVFEIGTAFLNIVNLVLILLIIYLVKLRYTSVARKEMTYFFWCLFASVLSSLIVDTGVCPPSSTAYAFFVSLQHATSALTSWSLLYAGICGFGLWEDGTRKSMLTLITSSVSVFAINYIVSIATFKGHSNTFSPSHTSALFTFYFILNPLLLVFWFISQLFICFVLIEVNWWAVGALSLTAFFYISSQVLLFGLNNQICEGLRHYADGTVFGCLSFMFCLMMLYKYWEIITFDDEEYYRNTQMVPGTGMKDNIY